MSYFECNLDKYTQLDYMHAAVFVEFRTVQKTVCARMRKLDEALSLTRMDGATFSRFARVLFSNSFDKFEKMTPKQLAGFVKMVDDGTKAPQRLEWPNATVVVDSAFVTTGEWEMIRHIGFGGSDASVVTGESEYSTLQKLYHDKRGTPVLLVEADDGRQALFDRGHILEDRVIQAFCDLTGAERVPETRMFASKTYPNCTANIDAILRFPDGRIFVFEGKTTNEFNRDAWSNGKIPRHYVPQMRQYPAVLNDDRIAGTYIGCLPTKDFVVGGEYVGSTYDVEKYVTRTLERDPESEKEQLEMEQSVWNEYVDACVEPPASGVPDKDIELIRSLTGPAATDAGDVEMSLADYEKTVKEYLALGEERKLLEDKAAGLKSRQEQLTIPLIQALGTSVRGVVDIDGGKYFEVKFSPRGKTSTDLEKLQIAFPEAYAQCVTKITEGSRVFSLKEKTFSKKEKEARAVRKAV